MPVDDAAGEVEPPSVSELVVDAVAGISGAEVLAPDSVEDSAGEEDAEVKPPVSVAISVDEEDAEVTPPVSVGVSLGDSVDEDALSDSVVLPRGGAVSEVDSGPWPVLYPVAVTPPVWSEAGVTVERVSGQTVVETGTVRVLTVTLSAGQSVTSALQLKTVSSVVVKMVEVELAPAGR